MSGEESEAETETVTVPVQFEVELDAGRSHHYREAADLLGEEMLETSINQSLNEELGQPITESVEGLVTEIYDNREAILREME